MSTADVQPQNLERSLTPTSSVHDIDYDKQPTQTVSTDGARPRTVSRYESVGKPGPDASLFAKLKFWVQDRDVHVWIMSLGFTLLFTAYPIQGVQTIRYPATGAYILIVLYSGYFATSMWATFFLDWWGLEFCLPWGPISYATWIACEFSGNNAANLVGAAFFGWGAGILWPAAGQLIATVSTPHNRASNAGIYQCAFHVGVWAGGLILGSVIKAFSNYNDQYAVFIGLCCASVITFLIHAYTFRRRFRKKTPAVQTDAVANTAGQQASTIVNEQGHTLHRVQNDDGTVEYRQVSKSDLKSEAAVVSDLALTGGRTDVNAKYTWAMWKKRFWQPLQMLAHPVFGPLGPAIFITGGMTQGWFNASFNIIVSQAGSEWNGWIYAISESFAIVFSVIFGLFYDKLRKNYAAHKYRWVMYVYVISFQCLMGLALASYYLSIRGVGNAPGQVNPSAFYAILAFTGGFYNIQLLALEVSILTYLTTFLTYNADIAFSSKIGCEAAGYLLVFGLVNVVEPRNMIIIIWAMSVPAMLTYLIYFHAPERPVATLVNEAELELSTNSSNESDVSLESHGVQKQLADYDGKVYAVEPQQAHTKTVAV